MDTVLETIAALVASWPEIAGAITMIVGGFAVLARFTPNESDDAIIQQILNVVNFLGMNHGKAKNDPSVK